MTSSTADDGTEPPGWPDPDHVLTWRQQTILRAIKDFAQRRGYPPALGEIGEAAGLARRSSVFYRLSILQRKGYLRRIAGGPAHHRAPAARPAHRPPRGRRPGGRSRHPVPRPGQRFSVPIYGQIAASPPTQAEQDIVDTWELPKELVGNGTLFRLQVRGDSMINAAIADGDLVVVRQQPQAENGDIVAAMIEGETMVKTLQRTNGQVWLMPHNPAYRAVG